jgi:alpha-tubulin suppressor-like RCC1 family protein
MFVVATRRLLACGEGAAQGNGYEWGHPCLSFPIAAMAGVPVRIVAAGFEYSLALGWDGRVYSWGINEARQLGHGDVLNRPSPTPVEELEDVRSIGAGYARSLAVMQSGAVFCWGASLQHQVPDSLRPIVVEGFGGVRVRRVAAAIGETLAFGEAGELFSWRFCHRLLLGHGDTQDQPSPKRVEALRGIRVSSVSVGEYHALALTEDGLVYAWGDNRERALLGNPDVERELLPQPFEALRGVRIGSMAAAGFCSYAVADTGEGWAWGLDSDVASPLGHGEACECPLPKPIEALRGIKVDAVAACDNHTLAVADDGSVYAWGHELAAKSGALGLGPRVRGAGRTVLTPRLIPDLRVACGL